MPPKKRSAAEADTGSQANGRQSKRQETADEDADSTQDNAQGASSEQPGESIDKGNPFDYLCMPQPYFDFKAEHRNKKSGDDEVDEDGDDAGDGNNDHDNDDENEDDWEDEDSDDDDDKGVHAKYNTMVKAFNKHGFQLVADKPDHKWIAMRDTIKQRTDIRIRADYTCPDLFNMYIYNDFHGYGLQEVIENSEFTKKTTPETLKQMWSNIAALNHWLCTGDIMPWIGCDDGNKVSATVELIGCALLAALNELDKAGHLKPASESEFKDIGLIISYALNWSAGLVDYGIDEVDFQKDLIAYAKKGGIDLVSAGTHDTADNMQSVEDEHGEIEALEGAANADRWGWKKALKAFKDDHEKFGGNEYNITKWSRKERARHAFDKKDPLAKFSDADIASGNLMIG